MLLFCDDELDFVDVLDGVLVEDDVEAVVLLTWWKPASPLIVPKPTTEATINPFFTLPTRAIAFAFGIFSGALGFCLYCGGFISIELLNFLAYLFAC